MFYFEQSEQIESFLLFRLQIAVLRLVEAGGGLDEAGLFILEIGEEIRRGEGE